MQQGQVKLSVLDYSKWLLAVVLVALCVVGNIYFASYPAAVRAGIIIVAVGLSLVILVTTSHGKIVWDFFKQARNELRKVVWPTRQETLQMTSIVAVIVVVMALLLWGFDTIFAALISHIVT